MKKVSEDMKRATGVYQRPGTSIWHWGIKAPIDLKHLYAGQWAHRCSLETADLRAVNTAAALLRGEWLARFERLRQGAEQSTAIAPVQLTQELVSEAAALMHARMLESDETQRMADLSPANMANQALVLDIESAQLRQAYATGSTWPVENVLNRPGFRGGSNL